MSDFWSDEQLNKIKIDYLRPKTVKELQKWTQENIYDLAQECSSLWPIDYSKIDDHPLNLKSFSFQKIAEIKSIDLEKISKTILQEFKNVNAKNSKVADWRQNSSEEKFLIENGFDRETHSQKVTEETYPLLYSIGKMVNLENYSMAIQYQPPGSIIARHVDFLGSMWTQFENKNLKVLDLPYNHITKSPAGYYAFRCMIALNDYCVGQTFGFENQYWTDWKIGDVITFDWAHARHYTANSSLSPRIYLKISGITQDKKHWIFNNLNNNIISQL